MSDFEDTVAVVTGGASGIGAATATELVRRGAAVFVLDRTPPSSPSPHVEYLSCDITRDADISAALTHVGAQRGRLDVLVNNAATSAVGAVTAHDRDEWRSVLEVNVVSVARTTALAVPLLRRSAAPAVVNVSSVGAVVGIRNRVLYCASKGAVSAMTLAMAADHLEEGIRVNAVAPGTTDTPWVARLVDAAADPESEAAALRARQPMGRLVSPPEVAWAICYLASPLAGSTTGVVLGVDGGMTGLRV